MQPETPKLLEDVRDACTFILDNTSGKTVDDFKADRLLYQAVERNFEIIGEAINRLIKTDPKTAAKINRYPQIIAFRNILIHGYDLIDREIVWQINLKNVPSLNSEVEVLLREAEGQA